MMRRRERTVLRVVLAVVAATMLAGLSVGCAGNRPPLEVDAVQPYNRFEAVRIVNDVGDVAIAANAAEKLSDPLTARILTIGWQVRDFIEANPTTTYARVIVAIREGLDATPPDLRMQISGYFDAAFAALEQLMKGVEP
jgi:hypothetical protein